MSRVVKFRVIQPDPGGPTFGQVPKASDLMKSQIFSHAHIEAIVRDWIVGACATDIVSGFAITLRGGMGIRVSAPGHVISAAGKSYEMIGTEFVDLTHVASDPALPRVDLVIVTLEPSVDQMDEMRPFIQLRTLTEIEAGVAGYPPQQFNEPTEEHTRGVVSIKAGTPDPVPVAPALDANQRAIARVSVGAGVTQIEETDISDVAHRVSSLCVLEDKLEDFIDTISDQEPVPHEHYAREIIIGPSSKRWAGKRVQDFIDFWEGFDDEDTTDPLTMPELLTATGKLGGVPHLDGAAEVIDLPYPLTGIRCAFSDRIIAITSDPNQWPTGAMPELVNLDGAADDDYLKHSTQLSMTVIDSIVSDGGGEWFKKTAVLPAGIQTFPAGRKSAARDNRYIEIFGAGGGPSWQTYDTVENTITPRVFSGDAPTRPVFFAAPCGNGNVILATAGTGTAGVSLSWYRVNATTGATTAIAGAPCQPDDPSATGGTSIVGDLIQANVILLAVFHNNGGVWRYFAYHVDSNSFEAIQIVGQGPEAGTDFSSHFDLCLYQPGEAVIVSGNGVTRPVSTTVLNYATRSWKKLNIPQPNSAGSRSNAISHFRLANINGRPQLVADLTRWDGSGQVNFDLDGSFVWELTPGEAPAWRSMATGLPARWSATIASLLSNGLARGNGYYSGGQVPFSSTIRNDIWEFAAGGVIETEFESQVGLTLRPGTSQVTFRVLNVPTIGFEVAKALVEPRGFIPPGSVRLRLSVDGGANFQEMPLRKVVDMLNSTDPAQRVLEVTMLSSGSTAPVLTDIIEVFERPAGPGLTGLFLRYRVPAGTKALCLNREGMLTFEAGVAPTTPDKAILNKTINNGAGVLAAYEEYENRRIIFKDFKGAKAGGVSPEFSYDLARPPKKILAWGVTGGATGPVYKIAEPVIAFDGQVTVNGLTSNGDNYIVECIA